MSDYYRPVTYADLPLFSEPPAQRHSETSKAAALSWSRRDLNATQRKVLEFLRARPAGATDEEIAVGLGLNPSTARPRRIELHGLGLVVAAGERKTSSNRNATVWMVV